MSDCHSEPAAVFAKGLGGELSRKMGRGRVRELGEQQEHLRRERKPLLMACDRQHRDRGDSELSSPGQRTQLCRIQRLVLDWSKESAKQHGGGLGWSRHGS